MQLYPNILITQQQVHQREKYKRKQKQHAHMPAAARSRQPPQFNHRSGQRIIRRAHGIAHPVQQYILFIHFRSYVDHQLDISRTRPCQYHPSQMHATPHRTQSLTSRISPTRPRNLSTLLSFALSTISRSCAAKIPSCPLPRPRSPPPCALTRRCAPSPNSNARLLAPCVAMRVDRSLARAQPSHQSTCPFIYNKFQNQKNPSAFHFRPIISQPFRCA